MSEKEPARKPLGIMANGLSIRVVVIDDEFSHRRIMTQTLKSAGFDVVSEGVNGEDALRYAAMFRPKMMFMDYHMPRMDGLTALKKLRETNPDTTVVMFTTDHDKDHVLELINAGAAEYVVKPIDRKILLQKIERLLET